MNRRSQSQSSIGESSNSCLTVSQLMEEALGSSDEPQKQCSSQDFTFHQPGDNLDIGSYSSNVSTQPLPSPITSPAFRATRKDKEVDRRPNNSFDDCTETYDPENTYLVDTDNEAPSNSAVQKGKAKGNENRKEHSGASWAWGYIKKVKTANGSMRAYCNLKPCRQKGGWKTGGGATTSIIRHLRTDHKNAIKPEHRIDGIDTDSTNSIEAALNKQASKAIPFTREAWKEAQCRHLVRHKLPFTYYESGTLKYLFQLALAAGSFDQLVFPSDTTVARNISDVYATFEMKIKDQLREVPKIAFTLDGWTSPYRESFLGVTAHFVDSNWQLQDLTIGFEPLTGSHTGDALMRAFVKVVERFGLQRKILSITSDNGSNVIKLMKSLAAYTEDNPDWDIFDANEQHVPCLAHVLNLAVQALLGVNGLGTSAPATSGNLDCEDDANDEAFEHDNIWLNGRDSDEEESDEEDSDEENNGGKDRDKTGINNNGTGAITKVALNKLRKAVTTIRRSTLLNETFKNATLSPSRSRGLCPLLDVKTRWGSTLAMIERALDCRAAFNDVLFGSQGNLRALILEADEWDRLEALRTLLSDFHITTTKACASKGYSTINLSITIYNDLMEAIEKFTRDKGNQRKYPDLIHGAEAAYDKLKQYYSATDKSPIYSVATTLHPFQRYQYWIDEEWDEEMVTDAKSAVRSVWARYQPKLGEDTTMAGMPSNGDSMAETDNIELRELYNRKRRRKEARKQHPDERHPNRDDELELFATGRCELQQPLFYWKMHQEEYPYLAKMARDYFAIPATSAPSERCFSKARAMLPYQRNRLGAGTLQKLMLLDSWFDYIDMKE